MSAQARGCQPLRNLGDLASRRFTGLFDDRDTELLIALALQSGQSLRSAQKGHSTRRDRLEAYAKFVKAQGHIIDKFGWWPGLVLQLAHNSNPDGMVHDTVTRFLSVVKPPSFFAIGRRVLQRSKSRRSYARSKGTVKSGQLR